MERGEQIKLMIGRLKGENDYSWKEINDLTGLNYSDSHIRKVAYGVKFYDDFIREKQLNLADEKSINELKEKILELKMERQNLRDERTYTNKKIRGLSRLNDFIGALKEELELLSSERPITWEVERPNNVVGKNDRHAALLISDIHYGIKTNNVLNKYNDKIAEKRMKYLVNQVKEKLLIDKLDSFHIFILGDTISGHIHNNLRLENRLNVVEQISGVAELISSAILEICKTNLPVVLHMVEGNHDRVLPNKNDNLNKDSFNVLVKELIAHRTANIENLTIEDSEEYGYLRTSIGEADIVAVHGDKDKPNSLLEGLTTFNKTLPDYVFLGHFHSANEWTKNRTEVIVNGSFSGTDEYALNIRKNSKPIQKMLIFEKGERTCTYNINLQNA